MVVHRCSENGLFEPNSWILCFWLLANETKYSELTLRAVLAENAQEVPFELTLVDQKGRGQIA